MRIRTLTVGALAVATALTLAGCTNPGEEMEGMDHGSASAAPDASAKRSRPRRPTSTSR